MEKSCLNCKNYDTSVKPCQQCGEDNNMWKGDNMEKEVVTFVLESDTRQIKISNKYNEDNLSIDDYIDDFVTFLRAISFCDDVIKKGLEEKLQYWEVV